jgi:hypothetical protein
VFALKKIKAPKKKTRFFAGIAKKERTLERSLEHKFHAFMDEWRAHIREEIAIHDAMLRGKRSFSEHLDDTRRIHEKFLARLKKL